MAVRDTMSIGEVVAILDREGYRITAPRRAVLDLILSRYGAFRTADLVADARRRGLPAGRATIFRTLETLTGLGAIERVDLPNGSHLYVRCDPAHHHHHLICSRCQRSMDLGDLGLTSILIEVEYRSGYSISGHRAEIFGLCPTCQATPPG